MRTLSLRGRLMLAALATVGVGLAVLTLGYNVVLAGRLKADADRLLNSRAQAQLANLKVVDGRLRVEETPGDAVLDERVWVYTSGGRALERPAASPALQSVALRLATGRSSSPAETEDVRLLALSVQLHGVRAGTVVSAVSLVPYERSAHVALIASLALGALLLVAVTLLARRAVTVALRPVARMSSAASDWSEHDLDRRFGLGPPRDELTSLAATLDGFLARLAASLRHEQHLTAELSHELRTPLAAIRTEAELALRRERGRDELAQALESVLAQIDRMNGVVEALMTAAEHEAGDSTSIDARSVAEAALARARDADDGRDLRFSLHADGDVGPVATDRRLAAQILGPVLDNAVRYGRTSVRLALARDDGVVRFAVEDDGPGVRPDELEGIFEPGVRGSAVRDERGGGLGLPLARRLARVAGGEVTAESSPDGGRFSVRLPSA